MAGLDMFSDEALESRPLEELRQIAWQRRALVQQLESEIDELQEQHALARRVVALEGAVELAQVGALIDPEERNHLLNNLLVDIRQDHHHVAPLKDHGPHAERVSHGVVFACPEHPIRAENDSISAHMQVPQSKRGLPPPDQPPHPYIGLEGAFGNAYRRADYGFTEKGWDSSAEVASARPTAAYNLAQPYLDSWCQAEDRAIRKIQTYKAYQTIEKNVSPFIPPCMRSGDGYAPTNIFQETEPLPYDQGDVWVNKAREAALTRGVEWQMAHAGIPVRGGAPPVDAEWLRNHFGVPPVNEQPAPVHVNDQAAIKQAEAQGIAVDRLGAYKQGKLEIEKKDQSWFGKFADQLP